VVALRAEYKKQSLLGDTLFPEIRKVSKNGAMTYTINLKDVSNNPVCIVELTTQ
jgi:hypothetical protein